MISKFLVQKLGDVTYLELIHEFYSESNQQLFSIQMNEKSLVIAISVQGPHVQFSVSIAKFMTIVEKSASELRGWAAEVRYLNEGYEPPTSKMTINRRVEITEGNPIQIRSEAGVPLLELGFDVSSAQNILTFLRGEELEFIEYNELMRVLNLLRQQPLPRPAP